jgi:hypothetical protein
LIPGDNFNVDTVAKATLAVDVGDGFASKFAFEWNIAWGCQKYPKLMNIYTFVYRIADFFSFGTIT